MLAQDGRSPEGPRPDVEGERNHRIELMLNERDAREQCGRDRCCVESVGRQKLIGLGLADRHPLDHAIGVTIADSPDPGGVLICLEAAALELFEEPEACGVQIQRLTPRRIGYVVHGAIPARRVVTEFRVGGHRPCGSDRTEREVNEKVIANLRISPSAAHV